MKKKIAITLALALALSLSLAIAVPVLANSPASSTMHFEGTLTAQGGGVYTGTAAMTEGEYYVTSGPGESISTAGGFDLYAKAGGEAYVQGYYGTGSWNGPGGNDTFLIGSDHDAYPAEHDGGPWGAWYNPDCEDWGQYHLELTADHWYLRYTATGESPMSGTMTWNGDGTGYAAETDKGTDDTTGDKTDPTLYTAGSAQEWGWNCGWGQERIPLQLPGFYVKVTSASPDYHVTMTPASRTDVGVSANLEVIVCISVDPTSIPYGTITVPLDQSDAITVTNCGTVAVTVTHEVVGDTLFTSYLGVTPASEDIGVGGNKDFTARLNVPGSYTPKGVETGTIIFWAEQM